MKKIVLVLSALLVLFVAGIYFFIPVSENFTYAVSTDCTNAAIQRFFLNKERWQQWWPGQKKEDQHYSYNGFTYRINKILLNGFDATVMNDKDSVNGFLSFEPAINGGVQVQWKTVFNHPGNPFTRLTSYLGNKNEKNNIESLLQDIKKFFDDEKNIYGFTASVQKVTDEFLINIKQQLDHYPTQQEVYGLVDEIRSYIKEKGGIEKNPPMLNIYNESPGAYQVMVAIPTTTQLPQVGKFLYRQMVLGNILVAEIKGGLYTISKAEKEIQFYITDHQKTSPAIPYQSLVTDRMAETDTAKWITKLYYPVFY